MKPAASHGLLDRTIQRRDARLFVIAIEGEPTGAEHAYFAELELRRLVDRRRVKLILLPADPALHDSAPGQVLARLDAHCQRHKMRERYDELWLVLDVDSWRSATLASVAQDALQRRYKLAVSNPCFEMWLLLHETDELQFLAAHEPKQRSGAMKRRLGELRAQGKQLITLERIWLARARAQRLDDKPGERWPGKPGTHVYKLMDALADADALPRPA